MQTLDSLNISRDISTVLSEVSSIAIVGLSPKESRPSNMVGRYLLDAGYKIYPVNPGQDEIFGLPCYRDVRDIPDQIDLVDIFRKSEDVLPVVENVLEMNFRPRAIWMQQGIVNEAAAELAEGKGIFVVMDRCIKVDHANLLR